MPKPFDSSTKFLVELNPTDWLRLLGLPLGPTRIAEADLSTVSSAADRLVVVDASTPYGLIVEFQGNSDPGFEARLLEYTVLAARRLSLPVPAVAVLLRPFAGHRALSGRYVVRGPDSELLLDFRYRVLRIWQMPPEAFLSGGLAVLPLATIARTRVRDLPRILDRIEERLEAETTPTAADYLRTATFILMGLKFDKLLVEKLMNRNVLELSSTYRALKEEALAEGEARGEAKGEVKEARRMILRFGAPRLGDPGAETIAAIERIADLDALESLADRLPSVESWSDLLPNLPN